MNITTLTTVCAVIGNPVSHSLSPAIHNAAIRHYKLNAMYLAFEVNNISDAMRGMRGLNIRAYSVTLPFKEAVMEYCDDIEQQAKDLRNVNTVVNERGVLKGYNTDIDGVRQSLKGIRIKDKDVVLMGAGGVAKTISCVISKKGGRLHIINREEKEGKELARIYGGTYHTFHHFEKTLKKYNPQLIINATPVGMGALKNQSLVPPSALHKEVTVFDVVYNPLKTKLQSDAQRRNAQSISGSVMFLEQGARQFKLWSGKEPPIDVMQKAFLSTINRINNFKNEFSDGL